MVAIISNIRKFGRQYYREWGSLETKELRQKLQEEL